MVDDHGTPIKTLAPGDFNVRIDGAVRRVVSAEWVPMVKETAETPAVTVPEGFSTNESSTSGRLIVIAVDEPNIRFGAASAIARAATAFVDRLSPSDRVAVAGFGTGAPATVFTADRQRIKQAIARMVGQKQARGLGDLGYTVSIAEALAIDRGDPNMLGQVVGRECQAFLGRADPGCADAVATQARTMALEASRDGDLTIGGLRDLFRGLRSIEGPKTLVLISEGFVLSDPSVVMNLGALAAAARTSVYALRLEGALFTAADGRMPIDAIGDRMALTEGLDTLTSATRGALFTVTGTGGALFQQIEAELSGYYQLGVESDPRDRDGKPHPIRVDVPRRGAMVRSRRQLLNTPSDERPARSPHQAVASALASPLLSSALPLRVASFALQGPEAGRVQLLIHADVGSDYSASKVASIAYFIADANGRIVENRAFDARLLPVVPGVPSPLQYTAGASLPPGDYLLKLAVVEGDRVGSIEHPVHAALGDAATDTKLSELMVGGPVEPGELLQPTIGYEVAYGAVHGYVEAYGAAAGDLAVEYEVAKDADSPALVDVDVPPHPAAGGRVIFTRVVPVQQLPPGRYLLRAVFSTGGRSIKTLMRAFEIAAPRVLMASADGLSPASFDAGVFLPVDETALRPSFEAATAIDAETIAPFATRIDASIRPAFDEGIAALGAGNFSKAQAAFKRAINPDTDSTPALAYLAAAFAAGGRDLEAAGAWQTALVDGTDLAQIYDWLAGALLRSHAYGEARSILEEAVGKWPSDVRFTKPLAMVYATFGSGREATRTLERYLGERRDDREACYLAVEWIYLVHAAGGYVQSRADDVAAAHGYANAYDRAHGSQTALVKQWLEFLDNEPRR